MPNLEQLEQSADCHGFNTVLPQSFRKIPISRNVFIATDHKLGSATGGGFQYDIVVGITTQLEITRNRNKLRDVADGSDKTINLLMCEISNATDAGSAKNIL